MSAQLVVTRGGTTSRITLALLAFAVIVLAATPWFFGVGGSGRAVALLVYVLLAVMWNALAGFAGLVSIGQTLFFGVAAYTTIRLSNAGLDPYLAILASVAIGAVLGYVTSLFMLSLKDGEFAIGMWVLSSLAHLCVNLDPLIQGETGTSLISLNGYAIETRSSITLWLALVLTLAVLAALFALLRSPTGAAITAVRDDELGARSIGVNVIRTKRIVFVLAATGTAAAGALWLASNLNFQPRAFFGVHWTAYMLFMVLVGGLGRIEGALIGAVLFFVIETFFASYGAWYLVGLGGVAVFFALVLPNGLWGWIGPRLPGEAIPTGYIINKSKT
ncbi:leucine/isoleucine/valine transporter permease subunit [Thalassovita gelatinovora]|uniref:Leucine/isoleucine/valine transporter permease subunit n=1 Tax=Thalassovita gelatinovora TaxID=53501 RepID=A0A0P1FQ64_THAGE|nr:branched-chain amino acid ABC transporter permease [Thalassovita gelatinovora]QIZ80902.1 branched-chain amino acid ABC transporter permease [Thalassovita gelatinovora]CUH63384.1 leucine/isoleucine/valine transporter permease subunit [Thalassovita gelatinovora]SEQ66134.1 amino acid/amide ABC transporter membrane protein 2, HAAT family [Thalassovita gelatinovora]